MRLFSQTSKLCLLTLLLMLVYGGDGQGHKSIFKRSFQAKVAGKCGIRPIDSPSLMSPKSWRLTGPSIAESNSANDDLNVESYSQGRVIGGRNAIPGQFPWQGSVHEVNIENDGSRSSSHHCGAVIINEYWLLCAAHCFFFNPDSKFRIYVGDHNRLVHEKAEQIFATEKIIQHENFNSTSADNDIALIKIKPKNGRGIRFNRNVQPACLPDRRTQFKVGSKCLLSGWGRTSPNGKGSVILQAAVLSIVDQRKCQEIHGTLGKVTKNMICAGDPAGKMGGCHRDSGGPLVCKVGNQYTVGGIVSWGSPGCRTDFPTVFARVTEFLPWIEDIISKDE